jgi:hypothetical protein
MDSVDARRHKDNSDLDKIKRGIKSIELASISSYL